MLLILYYNHYRNRNRGIFYSKVGGAEEIDFLVETRKKTLAHPAACVFFGGALEAGLVLGIRPLFDHNNHE